MKVGFLDSNNKRIKGVITDIHEGFVSIISEDDVLYLVYEDEINPKKIEKFKAENKKSWKIYGFILTQHVLDRIAFRYNSESPRHFISSSLGGALYKVKEASLVYGEFIVNLNYNVVYVIKDSHIVTSYKYYGSKYDNPKYSLISYSLDKN